MKSISTDSNYGQAGLNNHFKRLLRCMLSRGEEDGEDDARNSSEVQWQEGEWRKKGIEGKEKKRDGRRKEEEYEEKKKRKRHPSHIVPVVLRRNTVKHSL